MPTIDPNRPGYYTDGTPIPGAPGQAPQAGYPIGTNISGSAPAQDPAVAQRADEIRSVSGNAQPISRPGNPYNAQGSKVTHITADNKTVDSGRGAYDYYGVPTLASRAQGNEQYEFQEKLKQWEKEFEEMKRQNKFGNAVSAAEITRWAPSAITDMYPGWSNGGSQSRNTNTANQATLPATIANLYPGATNVVRDASGGYTFTSASGVRQRYYGGMIS